MNTRFMTLPYFKQYISRRSILKTRHNISQKIYEDNTNTLYNQLRVGVSSSVAQALIKMDWFLAILLGIVVVKFALHAQE